MSLAVSCGVSVQATNLCHLGSIFTSGAMDTLILEALYRAGVPTFDMGSNMKTFDVGWGSPIFHKMGREKVILVNAFLSLEYELLMCDTDVAWMRVHTSRPSFA